VIGERPALRQLTRRIVLPTSLAIGASGLQTTSYVGQAVLVVPTSPRRLKLPTPPRRSKLREAMADKTARHAGSAPRNRFAPFTSHLSLLTNHPPLSAIYEEACASSYQVQQLQARSVRVMKHERGGSNDAGIRAERGTFHRRQWFGRHSGFRDFQNQGIDETIAQ
jgi:hypothetical protein